MLKITVIAVGKLKEKYWREAVGEYSKRLGAYCRLIIKEVPDLAAANNLSPAAAEQIKKQEWQAIQRHIPAAAHVAVLDIKGKAVDSPGLAQWLEGLTVKGHSHLILIIGGSLGLPAEALATAHQRLSFSPLTFPHQLMRVILLEQIYRAFKINRKEPYHK